MTSGQWRPCRWPHRGFEGLPADDPDDSPGSFTTFAAPARAINAGVSQAVATRVSRQRDAEHLQPLSDGVWWV